MKYIVIVLVVLCPLVLFSACSDSSSPSSDDSITIQQLYPMAIGDNWTYELTEYKTDGSIKNNRTYTISIPSSENVQGNTAFLIVPNGDSSTRQLSYYNGTTEIITTYKNGSPVVGFHVLKNVGDIYTIKDTIEPGDVVRKDFGLLRAKNVSVTTVAGTFSTYQYDRIRLVGTSNTLDTDMITSQYYASGVGLVKQVDRYHNTTINALYQKYDFQLQEYTIK